MPGRAPGSFSAVHPRTPLHTMSIDKESTGLPEVNVHKRTTKVNLSIVVGVVLFLVAMGAVVGWLAATR